MVVSQSAWWLNGEIQPFGPHSTVQPQSFYTGGDRLGLGLQNTVLGSKICLETLAKKVEFA